MTVLGKIGIATTSLIYPLGIAVSPNKNINIGAGIATSTGTSINSVNDANTINLALELRGSPTLFPVGFVGINMSSPSYVLDVAGIGRIATLTSSHIGIGTANPIPGAFLHVKTSQTNASQSFTVTRPIALSTGISLNSVNDANTVNLPFELRGSSIILNSSLVGVNKTNPSYALDVTGDVNVSGEVRRNGTAYTNPDYVFEPNYKVFSIEELRNFLKTEKHLPGMPSNEDVKKDGVLLFEQNRKQLEKLEEAYLYILQLEERLNKVENIIKLWKSHLPSK
jgi:hypothetical protein